MKISNSAFKRYFMSMSYFKFYDLLQTHENTMHAREKINWNYQKTMHEQKLLMRRLTKDNKRRCSNHVKDICSSHGKTMLNHKIILKYFDHSMKRPLRNFTKKNGRETVICREVENFVNF